MTARTWFGPARSRWGRAGAAALAASVLAVGAAAAPASASVASAGSASSASPSGLQRRPSGDAQLDAALAHLRSSGATGVVAVVDDGRSHVARALGASRLSPLRATDVGDTTRVGSVTKTFVATAVLQQVGRHRLHLDEPVEKWLPGLVQNGRAITLRMLLQHTSGLYNYTDDEALLARYLADPIASITPTEILATALKKPASFAPGTRWSYSNTNYALLGLVLEKVTGRSAAQVLEEQIITPLGLHHTFLAGDAGWRGAHLHGYYPPSVTGQTGYTDVSRWNPSWAWTAGAVVSNAEDVTRFFRALFSGRLISTPLLKQMTTTVDAGGGVRYGLGIYSQDLGCGRVWTHNGGIPGYTTQVYTDGSGRRSAALFLSTELDQKIAAAFERAVTAVGCRMLGRPVPAKR